ncbi:hypothetical protein NDU88_002144 [Pleurodeles waltl]|uniref:Uncharacterized protein n=1 Tax=Pleurodeles waltl TaxID=8319 RepID=A0AAV7UAJ0_PLEWA|nr:hypothetical protein NDU88_002144 [Pleurodeles waltl]
MDNNVPSDAFMRMVVSRSANWGDAGGMDLLVRDSLPKRSTDELGNQSVSYADHTSICFCDITDYLSKVRSPSITPDAWDDLERPITRGGLGGDPSPKNV